MKPFNLQEALAGKPLITRGGEVVTDFGDASMLNPANYIYSRYKYKVDGVNLMCDEKGNYFSIQSNDDLFMKEETDAAIQLERGIGWKITDH